MAKKHFFQPPSRPFTREPTIRRFELFSFDNQQTVSARLLCTTEQWRQSIVYVCDSQDWRRF